MKKTLPLRYFDYTDAEREQFAKPTPEEKGAADAFLAAAKALPANLSISLDENPWRGQGHLTVSKRITEGSTSAIGSLRKKSLIF